MTYNFPPNRKLSLLESIYYYFHKKIYHYRLEHQIQFQNKFIVSIGNLTTGGTGKTPLTIELAKHFLKKQFKVLVCLRGYKGSFKGELLVADNGQILTTPFISGDEAYLIAYTLKQKDYKYFRVACGKDRKKLIQKYGENFDIILLDDAFQNPSIARNLEILLIDVTNRPDKIYLIPLGTYREPLDAIKRADIVLLTRTQENPEYLKHWEKIIKTFHKPYFLSHHVREGELPLPKQEEIVAVCGIGNPESFLKMLQNDYKIIKSYVYKDHYQFTSNDIQRWLQHKKPIVLTEKDWVRLLYNPLYLQNQLVFYPYSIRIDIRNKNHFWNLIYKNISYVWIKTTGLNAGKRKK